MTNSPLLQIDAGCVKVEDLYSPFYVHHLTLANKNLDSMSINWVMQKNGVPVELPQEAFVLSYQRVSLDMNSSHGNIASEGKIYLSRKRLVFIASTSSRYHVRDKGDKEFRDLTVPLKQIYGARVVQPWFGPNKWKADIRPVPEGGLEPDNQLWQLSLTFKDGGVFDFSTRMEALIEEEQRKDELPEYRP